MVAHLTVTKSDGTQLFDTSLIAYGLVRSGYLVQGDIWSRRTLRSINLDPNDGNSWFPAYVNSPSSGRGGYDQMWNFTVPNAKSPILFLVGDGCLNTVVVSGSTKTYVFGNASANTKVYAFDLMQDNFTGPHLKTFDAAGSITFNSLQYPLNVVAATAAPALGNLVNGQTAYYLTMYQSGYQQVINEGGSVQTPHITYSKVDVSLSGFGELASYLTFSRNATWDDGIAQYGVFEGCGGYSGGVRFMFGPSGGTPEASSAYGHAYSNVTANPRPTALSIRTAGLPFPFN